MLCLALTGLVPAAATAAIITFEGLPEGALTNQFAGLTFSNTYVLTAGVRSEQTGTAGHPHPNV